MFTGIIQTVGEVAGIERTATGMRVKVRVVRGGFAPDCEGGEGGGAWGAVGDSIAVNGCCLTVATLEGRGGEVAVFDAVPETLAKTTVGDWVVGREVHLERAATLGTLLGGHLVQGHVDGVGEVVSVEEAGEWRVRVRVAAEIAKYLSPKGSVAVDGVSLTLAALRGDREFEVALVPTTLEKTTLGALRPGARVNVEADMIAKTVVRHLECFMARAGGAGGREDHPGAE